MTADHDADAERAVLGACLLNPAAVAAARQVLRPHDFWRGAHGTVFEAILALAEAGRPADPITVLDALRAAGHEDDGGPASPVGLIGTLAATPSAANVAHYARIVGRHARRRAAVAGAEEALRAARAGDLDAYGVILRRAAAAVSANGEQPEMLATRRLADTPPERLEPLFGGRLLAGKLAVVAGPGGIGKSYLTLAVAAPLTRAVALPGDPFGSPPGDVLVASFEDDAADTLRPRAEKLGAVLDRLHVIDGVPGPNGRMRPFGPADIPRLAATLDRLPDARMVVIDPVGAWVGAAVDIHRENEVRGALEGLRTLCAERRLVGLLVMHLRKTAADSALARILGAAAFGNLVRSVLLAGLQPGCGSAEEGAAVAHIKHNVTARAPTLGYRIGAAGFAWTGEIDVDGETLAGHRGGADEDQTALAEATDWLADVLEGVADGGMGRSEVIRLGKAEGHTERTLERAAKDLCVVSVRDESKRGRPAVWHHPDYPPTDFGGKSVADNPQPADQHKQPPQGYYPPPIGLGGKSNQDADDYDPRSPL